ncbi:hypothetical protein SCALM49S_07028 [Streptomyces californicus]
MVLFLAFGSLAASLLPIATALVSVGTAYAGIVLLGHLMTVADFAPMLGMLIGLGVGIDYALFIVTRHRRGLKRGMSVPEAAQNAVATTGRAVVFAGATVCIALLGMLILRLGFLNGVAIAASLTVVLTVLASVTLLPALLSLIGMRALSRRERRQLAEHGPRPELPTGFAARWSAFVERHPKLLGAVAAVVMAVLALPALGLHLGTSDQGNNPATATTRQAYDLLADGFGPGVNGPLTIAAQLDGADDRLALDALPGTLRTTEGVASVSPVTYNGPGDTAFLTVVPDSSPQSQDTSELVDRIRGDVLPPVTADTSLEAHVGGVTASYDDFAEIIVGKLPLFVGVVIGLGCLLLLLAFRSIGIPLKAAVMNVAAVASSFGVVVAVFQWGWGSELLGLGTPDPIDPFRTGRGGAGAVGGGGVRTGAVRAGAVGAGDGRAGTVRCGGVRSGGVGSGADRARSARSGRRGHDHRPRKSSRTLVHLCDARRRGDQVSQPRFRRPRRGARPAHRGTRAGRVR